MCRAWSVSVTGRCCTRWSCVAKMCFVVNCVAILTLLICIIHTQEISDFCYTPTDEEGQCVLLPKCPILMPLIKTSRKVLKQFHCGEWENMVPKVCCPITSSTSFIATPEITTTSTSTTSTSITETPVDSCYTIEGKVGSCVNLSSCANILKMLEKPSIKSMEYFARSRCTGQDPSQYSVCCEATNMSYSELGTRDGICPETAILPDPDNECCGIEGSGANKIIGGTQASIDQYPWLAIIAYAIPQLCGGSLISNKYVLTAAHCVLTKKNKPRQVTGVILGEFNTTNAGPDCVPAEGGGTDCTSGSVEIPMASFTAHPEYNTHNTVQFSHDIALIRLAIAVAYNDFIKPICLPKTDITINPPLDTKFFVAGWGAVNVTRPKSDVKLYTSLPFYNHEKCRSVYRTFQGPLIWDKQICAGGEVNKDTCKGDSGGPLMYDNDKYQEVVGIISYGFTQCGIEKPSVYTKVYDYLQWIKDTIKP